jgi:trans-aconitate methyltransferase
MKTAVASAFYDRLLDDPATALLSDLADSPYRGLCEGAAAMIPPGSAVVELGSGTGRFAALLHERRLVSSYVGIDFAHALVVEARRHLGLDRFVEADFRDCPIPAADVYVALETLEHLDDDLALIGRLPARAMLVLSVPSFDSESHVRHFPEYGSARRRYEPFLDIDRLEYVELARPGAFFHLMRGVLR